MNAGKFGPWAALAACFAVSAAIASDAPSSSQQQQTRTAKAEVAGQSSPGSKAVHDAMMRGMQPLHSMKLTGDADRDFASMMIHHHQQAIAMAEAQLKHGSDQAVRKKAEEIIAASRKDIAELERWQTKQASAQQQASDP